MSFILLIEIAIWVWTIPVLYAMHNITYVCTSSGEIHMENPHVDIYKSATAADWTGSLCNVSMTTDLMNITISGCDKSNDIWVTLSDRSTNGSIGDGIIGGSFSETQVIRCQEIEFNGITFDQGVDFDMVTGSGGVLANVSKLDPVSPTVPLASSVWTQDGVNQITSAYVTDSVMWKIVGPVEYDIFPTTCTAYAGNAVGSSPSKLLIINGCTQDSHLVSHVETNVGSTVIKIYFSVFRFTLFQEITLSCTMKICLNETISCQMMRSVR